MGMDKTTMGQARLGGFNDRRNDSPVGALCYRGRTMKKPEKKEHSEECMDYGWKDDCLCGANGYNQAIEDFEKWVNGQLQSIPRLCNGNIKAKDLEIAFVALQGDKE